MHDATLVVMAKAPELGRVKTRLAADLGPVRALLVYRRLLAHTTMVAATWPGPVLLSWTGNEAMFADFVPANWTRQRQRDGTLGDRLAAALGAALAASPRAVVIGTDCPALDLRHLHHLDALLAAVDAAMGPARDGGFWGFATRRLGAAATLAEPGLPWSTAHTGVALRTALLRRGISCALGPCLDDVDTTADLRRVGWLDGPSFPPAGA